MERELAITHRGADEQAILQALASLGIFADMGTSLPVISKGVRRLRLRREGSGSMQTWRRTARACLALVVLSLAAPAGAGITPGKPAPEFSLRKLGGGRLALRDLRGKVVLLTFWTESCPPCHVEAPRLQALHGKHFGRGLRVVGVTPLSGAAADLHEFVRRHGITYPTLVDPGVRVVKRYGLQTYPLTLLIDRQGVVRWVHQGFRQGDELMMEREVVRLLVHR